MKSFIANVAAGVVATALVVTFGRVIARWPTANAEFPKVWDETSEQAPAYGVIGYFFVALLCLFVVLGFAALAAWSVMEFFENWAKGHFPPRDAVVAGAWGAVGLFYLFVQVPWLPMSGVMGRFPFRYFWWFWTLPAAG